MALSIALAFGVMLSAFGAPRRPNNRAPTLTGPGVPSSRHARLLFALFLTAGSLLSWAGSASAETFTVNSTGDAGDVAPGDGACDSLAATGTCTLRAAIQEANAFSGADTIDFRIGGGGAQTISPLTGLPAITQTISPLTGLPAITQPVTIDATQPGPGDAPRIRLDGGLVRTGGLDGLTITAGSSTVRALVISRFRGNGVRIEGSSDNEIARNVISANGLRGISIEGTLAARNRVEGNFIGTDASGELPLGNRFGGVYLRFARDNVIGGTAAGAGNVISGNGDAVARSGGPGVTIEHGAGNRVQGNLIGTDVTGTVDLGNFPDGVLLHNASGNLIGGTEPGARNVISGNDEAWGVSMCCSPGGDNRIEGNLIGTDITGTVALPNEAGGVIVQHASGNVVGGRAEGAGNVISGNGGPGVFVCCPSDEPISAANAILGNMISSNNGLGIDLGDGGVTPNDPGDGDSGPNGLQNAPVLADARRDGAITVRGTLNSVPKTSFTLEFFSNAACDPIGFGEGERLLGSTVLKTRADGNAKFNVSFPKSDQTGQFVTATATDPSGNTSEFSNCEFAS